MFSEGISSFYITLLSGCSLNLYPENSLSRFKVKLPYNLNLKNDIDQKWHVGVTRFACAPIADMKRIYEKSYVVFNLGDVRNRSIIEILQIHPKFLDLININTFFDIYNNDQHIISTPVIEENKFLKFKVLNLVIKIPVNYAFSQRVLFDYYFNQIPYEDRAIHIDNLITLLNNRVDLSTLKTSTKRYYESIVYEYKEFSNYICIYSDIIKPRIIGDQVSRSLYMHPIVNENDWLERNVINIKNVEYYPIEHTNISEIEILLADDGGEQIKFEKSSFSTMVLLHFKKGI